jgi:hypothetical protein
VEYARDVLANRTYRCFRAAGMIWNTSEAQALVALMMTALGAAPIEIASGNTNQEKCV